MFGALLVVVIIRNLYLLFTSAFKEDSISPECDLPKPVHYVTNVSEFEPLDGEHEKQRELVILILASVFCLMRKLIVDN